MAHTIASTSSETEAKTLRVLSSTSSDIDQLAEAYLPDGYAASLPIGVDNDDSFTVVGSYSSATVIRADTISGFIDAEILGALLTNKLPTSLRALLRQNSGPVIEDAPYLRKLKINEGMARRETIADLQRGYSIEGGDLISLATARMPFPMDMRDGSLSQSRNHRPAVTSDLDAALNELEGVREEAREEGYPDPTTQAIENARALVNVMYRIRRMRFDIYLVGEGEIVIDGGERGRRIGVFCYPDGRVVYIGWSDGERRRIQRQSLKDIPLDFLRQALHQLEAS